MSIDLEFEKFKCFAENLKAFARDRKGSEGYASARDYLLKETPFGLFRRLLIELGILFRLDRDEVIRTAAQQFYDSHPTSLKELIQQPPIVLRGASPQLSDKFSTLKEECELFLKELQANPKLALSTRKNEMDQRIKALECEIGAASHHTLMHEQMEHLKQRFASASKVSAPLKWE